MLRFLYLKELMKNFLASLQIASTFQIMSSLRRLTPPKKIQRNLSKMKITIQEQRNLIKRSLKQSFQPRVLLMYSKTPNTHSGLPQLVDQNMLVISLTLGQLLPLQSTWNNKLESWLRGNQTLRKLRLSKVNNWQILA